jgi:hypothetical protein
VSPDLATVRIEVGDLQDSGEYHKKNLGLDGKKIKKTIGKAFIA